MSSGPPLSSTTCMYCQTQLTFPASSQYIQCPNCKNTFPASPPVLPNNYISCIGCSTLLSHPPTSMTIQCPRCLIIMDLPARSSSSGGGGLAGAVGLPPGGEKSGSSSGNRKKRKDPLAPKRASNAYMIFCKERRVSLKQERPDLPFGQLGKTLGEMWRCMSVDEKKPWEDRATSERDRYKQEMNTYQTNQMLKAAPDAGVDNGVGGVDDGSGSGHQSDAGETDDGVHNKKLKTSDHILDGTNSTVPAPSASFVPAGADGTGATAPPENSESHLTHAPQIYDEVHH